MTEQEKHSCGFNHLSDEQKTLLSSDAADVFAQFIQDAYHGMLPADLAKGLGQTAVRAGLDHMATIMENALKYNQLCGKIVTSGFAHDVPR